LTELYYVTEDIVPNGTAKLSQKYGKTIKKAVLFTLILNNEK